LDCLPVADCSFGPGSLATMLGSEPEFTKQTIWFHPCWHEVTEPEKLPAITLDRSNRWFQTHHNLLRETRALAGDNFAVGMPDLVEGIDTLASLRDTNLLLLDFIERTEWVFEKVMEIHRVRLEVFDLFYEHCRTAEGWTFHSSFRFGGPGKTDKLQCDLAAMISPAMFRQFVVPHLREHCRHMDHTMFHLDGSECLDKLDDLLAIMEAAYVSAKAGKWVKVKSLVG
jgi:5-methyltetrahydrofolate--homocysteine methyltransferase